MITGLVVNKVVAVTIGPAGIAFVGQFVNFKALATSLASGSFSNGLTKYVADPKYDTTKVVATSNIFSLSVSVLLGVLIMFFGQYFSMMLLKDPTYAHIFRVFGFLLPLFALNTLLTATVNGFRNYKLLAWLKITNNVLGLILSVALVLSLNLKGALIAHAINSSIVFLASLIILHYYFSIQTVLSFNIKKFDKQVLLKLLAFTLMAITSAQLKPLVQLFIRNYIIQQGGEFDAGLWQAMNALSGQYLTIITTALGVYYLPKLSSLSSNIELRNEIFSGMRIILPAFLVIAVVVYFVKEYVIIILYSREFLEMKELFAPQLIGDFLKLFSFTIAYLMLAKAMVKLFMISQIVFASTRVFFSITLFDQFGVIGVIWANAINYFLYSIFVVIAFRKIILKNN